MRVAPEVIVSKVVKASYREAVGHILYGIGIVLGVLWFGGIGFIVADAWWPEDSGMAILIKAFIGLVPAMVIGVTGGLIRDDAQKKIRELTSQLTLADEDVAAEGSGSPEPARR